MKYKLIGFSFLILLNSCVVKKPYLGLSYIYRDKFPSNDEFHALILDNTDYFSYLLYTKTGTINERVEGDYKIEIDSLILEISNPIEYEIQKTSVKYSNYGSPEFVYFMFFELPPKVLEVNRHRYKKVSTSIIYECQSDTCPANQAIDSKGWSGWYFDDTVKVLKKYYDSIHTDTLNLFDPNDNLTDKKIPIKVEEYNCIKIYVALKPKFDLIEIPQRFKIIGRHLVTDYKNQKRKYKLLYNTGVSLDK